MDAAPNTQSPRKLVAYAAIALLALALYAPLIVPRPLDNEEGRRAIPAREMLASGDLVRPTVFGKLYLAKPPAMFWAIAACAQLRGEVDELAARAPSVAATLFTALVLVALGTRVASARTGLIAALLFLCAPEVLAKGITAEIEPLLGACVFAATAALWLARDDSLRWTIASGLALAPALLAKGPPALVFFAATAIAVSRVLGVRYFATWKPWLALALGILGLAAWIGLLLSREPSENVLRAWSAELDSGSGEGFAGYLEGRTRVLGGLALGFGPAMWIGAFAWRGSAARAARGEPVVRVALWSVALVAAFFLVAPPARARYLYPAIPWACIAAARIADLALDAAGPERARKRWRIAVAALAVLALLRGAQLAHFATRPERPGDADVVARAIDAAIPGGERLWTTRWDDFNELFYVRRDVRYAEDALELAPGSVVLVGPGAWRRVESGEWPVEPLLAPADGREFAVVRLR